MGGKTKAAVVAAAALALALGTVAVATAAMTCTLKVTPGVARYGGEVVFTPSINATAFPGDKFDIQQQLSTGVWEKWGEGLAVEDTITPDAAGNSVAEPLTILLDGSLTYPATLRAVYVPKSSKTASAASDPVTLQMIRNARTAVLPTVPRGVRHGVAFWVGAQVTPMSGPGRVQVAVTKMSGGTYGRTQYITLDSEAQGRILVRVPTTGTYRVRMHFLGNAFGARSPIVDRMVVAR